MTLLTIHRVRVGWARAHHCPLEACADNHRRPSLMFRTDPQIAILSSGTAMVGQGPPYGVAGSVGIFNTASNAGFGLRARSNSSG